MFQVSTDVHKTGKHLIFNYSETAFCLIFVFLCLVFLVFCQFVSCFDYFVSFFLFCFCHFVSTPLQMLNFFHVSRLFLCSLLIIQKDVSPCWMDLQQLAALFTVSEQIHTNLSELTQELSKVTREMSKITRKMAQITQNLFEMRMFE